MNILKIMRLKKSMKIYIIFSMNSGANCKSILIDKLLFSYYLEIL
jgi:hypothetical protein